jgi:hypothetical protein
MMKTHYQYLIIFFSLLIFTGCGANLLPSTKITVKSPWVNYNNARLTYEKIIPGSSTIEDVKKLGFDPDSVPNIKIMTITDIITMFLPNPSVRIEDLDPGIQACIESKNDCTGYQIGPSVLNADRVGNFWLDLFTFKRHTINTGWEFRGFIAIVNNVVTYRDPSGGRPLINTEQVDIKPLGPLQEIGGAVAAGIPKLWGW